MPRSLKEIWYWFLQLNSTRSSGFGISAITYSEMLSFFTLYGIQPEDSDIEIIRLFDGIALEQSRSSQEKEQHKNRAKK